MGIGEMGPEAEKPAELLARVGDRYGPKLVAFARMLATLNERDWARVFNLMRETTRERLEQVESDMLRHNHYGRKDKAEQLEQFRVLYARVKDIAAVAGGLILDFAGDSPTARVSLFVDLFSAVCVMIGHSDIAPDVPQDLQRSGVPGVWPTAAPGRPVKMPTFANVAPLKSPGFNPKFHQRNATVGPVALYAPHGYGVACSRCLTVSDMSGAPLPIVGFNCACGAWVDCGKTPVDPPAEQLAEDASGFAPGHPSNPMRSDKSASPYSGGFPPGTPLT